MQLKSLLKEVHPLKSFVYASFGREGEEEGAPVVVQVVPRKNSRPECSGCGRPGPVHDTAPRPRRFQFVPLWGMPVFLSYRMRRVGCARCGVKVERVPWAQGKSPRTKALELFLARWARRLSWKGVADTFGTSWEAVYRSVKAVVAYGLAARSTEGIEAVGVDEVYAGKRLGYLTLVYQIDEGRRRLLFAGEKRRAKTLLRFFHDLGPEACARIRYVCSDMWKPYLKVIAKKLPGALHVLDRFHLVAKLNEAVDKVRREEVKRLAREGYEPALKNSRYCFLKKRQNLTAKQEAKLSDLMLYNLRTVRAYGYKASFETFWKYNSWYWADWYLRKWCAGVMRSRLDPLKKFVGTIRNHQPLILNYFKARKAYSCGVVEGLNRKVNLTTRKAYGFRTTDALKMALYHELGDLPEPPTTHRFC